MKLYQKINRFWIVFIIFNLTGLGCAGILWSFSKAKYSTEEVYFIMAGKGLYTEEGEECPALPGDVFLCREGRSHGILNTGEEKLVLGAAITKSAV